VANFDIGLVFDKARRVLQLEIGQQLALCSRDELTRFFPGDHKRRFRLIEICRFAKKIGVERACKSLVRADNQDQLLFASRM